MTYTYIGYGTTDANGIATLDHDSEGNTLSHSYTGTGAGKIDIVASLDNPITNSSLVSETYSVFDCVFMDYKSNNTKNTNWVANSNANVTTDDSTGETTVSATANATYRSTQLLSGDFEAILEAKTNDTIVRVGFTDNDSKYLRVSFNQTDYNFLKFRRVGSTWTIQKSADGETWTTINTNIEQSSTPLTDDNCYITIRINIPSGGERSITYKNLRIYPI